MKKWNVRALCRMALLVAVYVLLSITLAIKTPYLEFTFKSLPVMAGALLFGPVVGGLVALIGEFLSQLLAWGLTPTTILWVLPPVANGLVVGAVAARLWKTGQPLENRPVACYGVCLLGSVATSCVTTVSLWLDSLIYHYYSFAVVFGSALIRFGKDIVVVAVVTTVAIPLVQLLRRGGLVAAAR